MPGGNRDQASLSELETLIETYEFANKGREAFLQGLISLDEFLQILEFCEINVDNYLNTLEDNISRFLIL